MAGEVETLRVQRALIDSLYTESMLLADEARAYFDVVGREQRDMLGAMDRVVFSCESLKVTTRLMHSIAWLLTQRAVAAGEIAPVEARHPSRRLGEAPVTDAEVLDAMPVGAQHLIAASIDLHRRIARLDAAQDDDAAITISPARTMLERLTHAF
jgi:regulator of CtrA degradation